MRRFTNSYGVFSVFLAFGVLLAGEGVHEARAATWSSDFDHDGDVDLTDFSGFAACFNGPNRLPTTACAVAADLDIDTDVDLLDFAVFTACFNGPNRLPACAPDSPPYMVVIPAGEFQMGDTFSEGDFNEQPVHAVHIDAFYMDATEVTKTFWDEVRAWATANGYSDLVVGASRAGTHPVHTVNWFDCVKWCNARSQKDGRTPCYYTDSALTMVYKTGEVEPYVNWDVDGYRLPTEAEWEKAARGGASGRRFPWSDSDLIQHARANYYSWDYYTYDTSPTRGYHPLFIVYGSPHTSPAGYFAPNGYGLYGMAGNVYELCNDWYNSTYYSRTPYPHVNPHGPAGGSYRVHRGGFCHGYADVCRVAFRWYVDPDSRSTIIGFRCAVGTGGN
ncbi:MAG: SUMF1/EgtB/PvdO family nonheme iron enzyme [Phycisphaerae bacterium]|nr:SUMF1/EgtB/PvdO family nonheme iron enzyme [Phycisphaerae bacterium]